MKNDEANTRTAPFLRVNEDCRFLADEAMKREKSIMAKEKKIIPIAERRTIFPANSNIKNSSYGGYDTSGLSEEEFEELISKSLLISSGQTITHFLDEYPIAVYKCDESACYEIDPEYRLNAFVRCIHLSIADAGKEWCIKKEDSFDSNYVNESVIAYYEDNYGNRKMIEQRELISFLFRKPELVVSPEGVLVFYTNKDILATLDMDHYIYINDADILQDGFNIVQCKVNNEGLTIHIMDNNDGVLMSRSAGTYRLNFSFDFTECEPIHYTLTKV